TPARPLMVACCDPASTGPPRPAALTGGSRLRLLRARTGRARLGQGLGEDVRRDRGAGSHPPGSLVPRRSRVLVPVDADHRMLHLAPGPTAPSARGPGPQKGMIAAQTVRSQMPRWRNPSCYPSPTMAV